MSLTETAIAAYDQTRATLEDRAAIPLAKIVRRSVGDVRPLVTAVGDRAVEATVDGVVFEGRYVGNGILSLDPFDPWLLSQWRFAVDGVDVMSLAHLGEVLKARPGSSADGPV